MIDYNNTDLFYPAIKLMIFEKVGQLSPSMDGTWHEVDYRGWRDLCRQFDGMYPPKDQPDFGTFTKEFTEAFTPYWERVVNLAGKEPITTPENGNETPSETEEEKAAKAAAAAAAAEAAANAAAEEEAKRRNDEAEAEAARLAEEAAAKNAQQLDNQFGDLERDPIPDEDAPDPEEGE